MSFVFNLVPLLLLCWHPSRFFQRCLNNLGLRHQALHTFMDEFQGCYKHIPIFSSFLFDCAICKHGFLCYIWSYTISSNSLLLVSSLHHNVGYSIQEQMAPLHQHNTDGFPPDIIHFNPIRGRKWLYQCCIKISVHWKLIP